MADPACDAEMKKMAEEEMHDLQKQLPELTKAVQLALLPKDAADEKNAILEVRAGTGGDEAALFAADLFRMYQRYAQSQGWKFEIMSVSEGGIGGYQGCHGGNHRPRRVRQTQIRIGRASRAARAENGNARAHPHFGGYRGRFA